MLQLELDLMAGRIHPLGHGPSIPSIGDLLPLDRFPVFIIIVSYFFLLASSASSYAVRRLARFARREGRRWSMGVGGRGLDGTWSGRLSKEARRTTTEYSVRIADGSFAPCRSTSAARCCRRSCALDVVVEAFDDVASAGLFEVRGFCFEDFVFETELRKIVSTARRDELRALNAPSCYL
jgi:hypothetical protein